MPSIKDTIKYAQVPHDLLSAGLSAGAVKTYAIIRMKAWDYGGEYLSGVESLAEQVGVSRQSVSAYLNELEALGAIERRRRPRGRANAPLAVTHPSLYDLDALKRFQRSSGKAEATTRATPVVKAPRAVVKPSDKRNVKATGRRSSRGADVSIEEDFLKKQEEESRSLFLEEEEYAGEREWHIVRTGKEYVLDIPDHLETSDHARSLLRTAESAMAADRGQEVMTVLMRHYREAPTLRTAAKLLSDWWLEDVGF